MPAHANKTRSFSCVDSSKSATGRNRPPRVPRRTTQSRHSRLGKNTTVATLAMHAADLCVKCGICRYGASSVASAEYIIHRLCRVATVAQEEIPHLPPRCAPVPAPSVAGALLFAVCVCARARACARACMGAGRGRETTTLCRPRGPRADPRAHAQPLSLSPSPWHNLRI